MPQTGISEKFGSSGVSFDNIPGYQVKKSRFNLSFLKKGTIDVGEIKLLCCIHCVPNSSHDISLRYLLKSFPLVVPPSTNYKVVTHFYFCSYESLWKGAETFVTKGRNSNVVLELPSASLPDGPISERDVTFGGTSVINGSSQLRSLAVPQSLWCDFDLPPLFYPKADSDSYSKMFLPSLPSFDLVSTGRKMVTGKISLMQAFAYQKIYRSNYVSPNLLQNNKIWFPDDISSEEWRIDFNSSNLKSYSNGACYFVPIGSSFSSRSIASTVPYVGEKQSDGTYLGDTCVNIWQKRYAMFPGDRFMDAKPWLVRGEETTVNADISQLSVSATFNGVDSDLTVRAVNGRSYNVSLSPNSDGSTMNVNLPGATFSGSTPAFVTPQGNIDVDVSGNANVSLTANQLRTLMALSIKAEIDALTNGNYNPTIAAQFGVDPNHVDFDPKYIGGTVDYIQMNEITQVSSSDSSPLGTQGALARGQSQGHIANFFCKDFGYILGVMIISPDVVYAQGIDRQWTDIDQDSVFFPIYNELGFEPVKNQELYISGEQSVDENLYAYTTRNSHMKVNMNKATGFMALPPEVDALFAAYSQTREFSSLPKLSQELLTMSPGNIRRDYLHFTSYPAYRLDFAVDDIGILPLPYSSVPNRMGF